jgi:glycosyltransferase involved in cell wall biosynthesis
MKICQVLAGNEDGGLEKHTIELSKQLKLMNIDVSVIAHKDFAPYFQSVNFIPLDLSKGRKNIFTLFKLYLILKEGNFDIVHSQANKATAMVSRIKAFLKASKFISTLHSYKKNLKPFEKSDFVISVSNKISENLKNSNKKTIYNGIEFDKLNNIDEVYKKYNIPKDKFLICSVGRLCDVKRFDILIKSLKGLDVFCILIGDGENKEQLKKLSKIENVENQIIFTGNISNMDVKKIITISKLFVITSDKEGFPYVFVESLLYKTPVISTDVSDIKDIIGDNNIFEFNNSKVLSSKISTIYEEYDSEFQKNKKIFEFARKKFLLKNMIKETIEIYKEVLK